MNKVTRNLSAALFVIALTACAPESDTTGTQQTDVAPVDATTTEQAVTQAAPAETAPVATVSLTELSAAQLQQAPQVIDSCNIEKFNGLSFSGDMTLTLGSALSLEGWAFDKSMPTSATQLFVRIANVDTGAQWQQAITERVARDDVKATFTAASDAGFRVSMDTATLPAGAYKIYLAMQNESMTNVCDNGRKMNLLAK